MSEEENGTGAVNELKTELMEKKKLIDETYSEEISEKEAEINRIKNQLKNQYLESVEQAKLHDREVARVTELFISKLGYGPLAPAEFTRGDGNKTKNPDSAFIKPLNSKSKHLFIIETKTRGDSHSSQLKAISQLTEVENNRSKIKERYGLSGQILVSYAIQVQGEHVPELEDFLKNYKKEKVQNNPTSETEERVFSNLFVLGSYEKDSGKKTKMRFRNPLKSTVYNSKIKMRHDYLVETTVFESRIYSDIPCLNVSIFSETKDRFSKADLHKEFPGWFLNFNDQNLEKSVENLLHLAIKWEIIKEISEDIYEILVKDPNTRSEKAIERWIDGKVDEKAQEKNEIAKLLNEIIELKKQRKKEKLELNREYKKKIKSIEKKTTGPTLEDFMQKQNKN